MITIGRNVLGPVTIIAVLSLFLGGCSDLFFHPSSEQFLTPDQLQLSYEDVLLKDEHEPDLHGWYLPVRQGPRLGTIVFLHGNAENISSHINSVYWLPDYGYEVLLAEYRGYGASAGTPSLEGVHRDAERFLRYATERLHTEDVPLFLYGQSLGATIALTVAADKKNVFPIAAVIAEAPFSGYQMMSREALKPLGWFRYPLYPFSLLVSDSFAPIDIVANISVPVLLIHGQTDTVVSPEHSELLFEKVAQGSLWRVPGVGHLEIFRDQKTRMRLLEIVQLTIARSMKNPTDS